MARLRRNNIEGKQRSGSAEAIKATAMRLFAERGVDGVTVREIAAAAGQKNHGVVGYYFGSKEALVREIVADGARRIDERRNHMLDRIEAEGGPHTVREAIDAIIFPSIEPQGAGGGEDHYIRFITMLNLTHRELFLDAVSRRWNSGYQRCLAHLRRLMPPMSDAAKNQRLLFLGNYIAIVLTLRQTALADTGRTHPTWRSEQTLRHLAQTATALIEADMPEEETQARSVGLARAR